MARARRLRLAEEARHLGVHRARGLVAVVVRRRRSPIHGAPAPRLEAHEAHRLAHAELAHHAAGQVGRVEQIVLRAGGDLADGGLLGDAAAEQHHQAVLDLLPAHQEAILASGAVMV